MPGTWAANKCGYCDYQSGTALDEYKCPDCKRSGCPQCMPTGDTDKCNQCVERDERDRALGLIP
jgi:hypothetical protein